MHLTWFSMCRCSRSISRQWPLCTISLAQSSHRKKECSDHGGRERCACLKLLACKDYGRNRRNHTMWWPQRPRTLRSTISVDVCIRIEPEEGGNEEVHKVNLSFSGLGKCRAESRIYRERERERKPCLQFSLHLYLSGGDSSSHATNLQESHPLLHYFINILILCPTELQGCGGGVVSTQRCPTLSRVQPDDQEPLNRLSLHELFLRGSSRGKRPTNAQECSGKPMLPRGVLFWLVFLQTHTHTEWLQGGNVPTDNK